MGYNALPALATVDPAIPDRIELELSGITQFSGISYDNNAAAPYFRVLLPFRGIAALEVDGTPIEAWDTTAATQAKYGAEKRSGVSPGDLRVGGRYLFRDEDESGPAVALRARTRARSASPTRRRTRSRGSSAAISPTVPRGSASSGSSASWPGR